MHETVIARNIITEAEKHGEVEEIFLELGELGHVPPEELVACIRELVDWKISWTEKKATVECSCGFSGHPIVLERGHDSYLIECPQCKEMPLVTGGTEAVITKVLVK